MSVSEDAIQLLHQIASTLGRIERSLAANAPAEVADDSDLDSKYGDPEIKKDPPKWAKAGGASFSGRRYSETTPEYLEAVASFCDWKAKIAEDKGEVTGSGKPLAPYMRRDAARARGWARRLRSGWKPPVSSTSSVSFDGGGSGLDGGSDDFGGGVFADEPPPF